MSNEIRDPFEALKAYRSREKIEELFATYKDSFDGRKPRTWYPENLYGRQFAQFVGLGYHCFLTKRIQDVKKGLAQKSTEKKTKEELRKLFKSTLNNRLHRNLACVIDKSSQGAKLKRAFEELP